MSNLFNMIKSTLLTKSFAVTVISILLGASAAGWILTEMIPINFPYYIDMYRDRWGDGIVRIIEFFRLYDPFHSFWFCGVLALFFVVLLLCVLSRSGRFVARAFRFNPPSGLVDLEGKRPRLEIPWRELRAGDGASKDLLALLEKRYASTETIDATLVRDIYGRLSSLFRTRGYSLAADETD